MEEAAPLFKWSPSSKLKTISQLAIEILQTSVRHGWYSGTKKAVFLVEMIWEPGWAAFISAEHFYRPSSCKRQLFQLAVQTFSDTTSISLLVPPPPAINFCIKGHYQFWPSLLYYSTLNILCLESTLILLYKIGESTPSCTCMLKRVKDRAQTRSVILKRSTFPSPQVNAESQLWGYMVVSSTGFQKLSLSLARGNRPDFRLAVWTWSFQQNLIFLLA